MTASTKTRRTKKQPAPGSNTAPASPPQATPQAGGRTAPRCPRCDATDHAVIRINQVQEHAGITPAGERYTSVERRRVRCQACGQHYIRTDRPFEPDKWAARGNPARK